jgi:hypothetical protein
MREPAFTASNHLVAITEGSDGIRFLFRRAPGRTVLLHLKPPSFRRLYTYHFHSADGLVDPFACLGTTMVQRLNDTLGAVRGCFPWDFQRFRPDIMVSHVCFLCASNGTYEFKTVSHG